MSIWQKMFYSSKFIFAARLRYGGYCCGDVAVWLTACLYVRHVDVLCPND